MTSRWIVPAAIVATLISAPALAQKMFVYPAKGQNPQQQQRDEFDCHKWAIQQTGYDPSNPPPQQVYSQPSGPAQPESGSGARGALRGAAVGGVIGGIGGRGGEGAAVGAVMGGIAGRQRSRRDAEHQQQMQQQQAQYQQSAANAAGPDAYNRARAGCLTGRGYTVN